jgi:hypothetical protein
MAMERLDATCSGKLFWIWGLYAGGTVVLGATERL